MRLHLLLLAAGCDAFNVPAATSSMYSAARRASLRLSEPPDPEHEAKVAKALKAMTGFANSYCKNTETSYCSDPSIPSVCRTARPPAPRLIPSTHVREQVVIKGLAEHKVVLGAPLCPCRHYEDKQAEAKDGYWNCPCVPMRERHECHCMLFLTKDNEFAGDSQKLDVDDVLEHTSLMSIL